MFRLNDLAPGLTKAQICQFLGTTRCISGCLVVARESSGVNGIPNALSWLPKSDHEGDAVLRFKKLCFDLLSIIILSPICILERQFQGTELSQSVTEFSEIFGAVA